METLTSLYPFFLDWLDLIIRWIHIIVGIAWIGTSFYFNWLDSRLDREIDNNDVDGELWSVHSGGFSFWFSFAFFSTFSIYLARRIARNSAS